MKKILILFVMLLPMWVGATWKWGSARKSFVVAGSAEQELNYQVLLTVDTRSMIEEGTMRSDGADIRFYNLYGDTLHHFLRDSINTIRTHIWVKVDTIPIAGTTIYMYYGSSGASTMSDPDSTFVMYDTFSNAEYDTNKWAFYTDKVGATIAISSGRLKLTTVNDWDNITIFYAKNWIQGGLEIIWDEEQYLSGNNAWYHFKLVSVTADTIMDYSPRISLANRGVTTQIKPAAAYETNEALTTVPSLTKVLWDKNYWACYDGNRDHLVSGTIHTTMVSDLSKRSIQWSFMSSSRVISLYLDNIQIRKYARPEPTVSVGIEEDSSRSYYSFATDNSGTLTAGLKHFYKMDESLVHAGLIDAIGTPDGPAIASDTVVTGVVGNARAFGSGNQLQCQISTDPKFSFLNGTISMWVKAWTHQTDCGLVVKGSGDMDYTNFGVYLRGTTLEAASGFEPGGGSNAVTLTSTAAHDSVTGNSRWHHIVYSWASNDSIKLYCDGALRTSALFAHVAYTGSVADDPYSFDIGGCRNVTNNDTIYGWVGSIDEVGLWNKELSQQEVTDLYGSGFGNELTVTGGVTGWSHTMSGFNPSAVGGIPKANIVHVGGVQ